MKKFESLTKYVPLIANDPLGEWVFDRENSGTRDQPKEAPFLRYSELVFSFLTDFYAFQTKNAPSLLARYADILKENGVAWSQSSMREADVSAMDSQAVLALIMGVAQAERFCEGTFGSFFRDGTMTKWLQRLSELDADSELAKP